MFPRFPEAEQGGAEAEAPLGTPSLDQRMERHGEVVVLNLKTVEPLGMSHYVFRAFFSEYEVIGGMGSANRRFIVALDQAFEGILADGGEHDESSFRIHLLHLLRQALVHHGSHPVEYVKAQITLGIADSFRTFQGAAAAEYGKPPEKSLFSSVEQTVTPIHGAAQCLLTSRQIAGAAGQEAQTALEPREQGGR